MYSAEEIKAMLDACTSQRDKLVLITFPVAGFRDGAICSAVHLRSPVANGCAQESAVARWAGVYQSPEEVVGKSLRAFANGGGLVVPGTLNKFSVFAQRIIPRKTVPRLIAKMSKA